MRVIPSVEIEADAVLRLTLLPVGSPFSPTWSRREGERDGGKEGGREGGRKEGREGGPISMEGRAPICISTIRLQIGHLFDKYMHYLHCALTT